MRATRRTKQTVGLLGLGLDGDDGHKRLTRGENFVLWGGSQETHSQMQETMLKLNEQLERRGERLEEVSLRQLRDMLGECSR